MEKESQWTISKSEEKEEIITPQCTAPSYVNAKWREWDLNPRPRAYESPALPLSYLAV